MSNWTTGSFLKKQYDLLGYYYPHNPNNITWRTALVNTKEVRGCETRVRRKKPSILLPRFGTRNNYQTVEYATDTSGWYIVNGLVKQIPLIEAIADNSWYYVASSNYDTTYLHSVAMNRIREEICSQKSQLAVDLAELGKTKSLLSTWGRELLHGYRSIRGGRAFSDFVRYMNRNGWRSEIGRKWLEYIYGCAPTIAGAFETAKVLNEDFSVGKIYAGKTKRHSYKKTLKLSTSSYNHTHLITNTSIGYYQYTVTDKTLKKFSDLGFTNPLSIAWELTPWSFVFDWFVDVGGYINRMDFALGVKDPWGQTATRSIVKTLYDCPKYAGWPSTGIHTKGLTICVNSERSLPTSSIPNKFMGLKKFTNESVRLTTSLALINQISERIKRVR